MEKAGEIPTTYLNKGHAYSVSIIDTAPKIPGPTPVQYRTSIRISFEDGQQGQRSATRWRLWKEGRGTTEAHQRGGKLQGVEYVEAKHATEDGGQEVRINLETASLDGFSVLWNQGSGGLAECNIALRFHFLSTDFSYAKGVQGIPSRLCAKTEVVSPQSIPDSLEVPEISFCTVKLFRDRGAERKLSNDIVYVKKIIDKLQQKIVQVETTIKDPKKKRQSRSISANTTRCSRSDKTSRQKRVLSMLSARTIKEDLQLGLRMMQDMLSSTRPVSVLCFRGPERDDPDLHAVFPAHGQRSGFQTMMPVSSGLRYSDPQQLPSSPDVSAKVHTPQEDSHGTSDRWIEALGVDSLYIPSPEPPPKPGTFDIFIPSEKFC
jgi:hypothetical protein